MENRVGDVVPSDKEVAQLVKDIESVAQRVAKFGVHLTPEERRRVPKMRDGGEKLVPLVGELAGIRKLDIPGMSVDGMKADLLLTDRLAPVANAAEALAQLLADTRLEAGGECWWAFTSFYSLLGSMAARDPKLATALKPAVDFFAIGRRKPRAAPAK